jgi:Protein of unknown function (DUF2721).
MQTAPTVDTIAHVIQLSVAPVFLLTGVGAMLSVLGLRLARIVDRARQLGAGDPALLSEHEAELPQLALRAGLTNWAIGWCIGCAILTSSVIVALFVGAFVPWDYSGLIAALFIGAILALIAGLLCFLRESLIATRALRFVGRTTRPRSP